MGEKTTTNENQEIDVEGLLANLDQTDGESDTIDYEALAEMGIDTERPTSKNQTSKKEVKKVEKNPVKDILKELGGNDKQFDAESEDEAEKSINEELEGEESDEDQLDEESEDEDESIFEIIHNNEKKSLNLKELKELAQKGFDYTQKTQNLSKERKEIELKNKEIKTYESKVLSELQQQREQFKNDLDLKKQMDYVVDYMKVENPDLYNELQGYFKTASLQYKNPLIDQMAKRIEELETRHVAQSDKEIANQYYSELSSLKESLIPRMSKLGISVDEDAIKQAWINGAKDVKAAVYSLYGDSLNKLLSSKAKVEETRNKIITKKGAGLSSANGVKKVSKSSPIANYGDISRRILGY